MNDEQKECLKQQLKTIKNELDRAIITKNHINSKLYEHRKNIDNVNIRIDTLNEQMMKLNENL